MNTKQRILDAALTLLSQKGYANVYVAEIAEAVGIKAPSLYKHYKSKQDIFQAILDEMKSRYDHQAASLHMNGNDAAMDAQLFSNLSEDGLVRMGMGLFLHFLHDDYAQRFRKMLTIEQFRDAELAQLFSRQYADDPLAYQSAMFATLIAGGVLIAQKPDVMALQFYAPIYMLLTLCDREPSREAELTAFLENHIRQFNKMYQREENK
ncbi:MAG: TetR/AcrR family transcriptional regulator [Clostridia bacterium]|nr:TetR/AcrR family transcriptional regulator [Clostridia bacterium]